MGRWASNSQKSRAFTLLELLIVLGLLLLIAGLLFPVFSQARERVRHRNCLYNLKLIGLATSMYLEDNDQVFPPAWGGCTSNQGWRMTTWAWELEPYVQAGVVNDADGHHSDGAWARSGGQLWHCPSDKAGSNISYGVNALVAGAYPQVDCSEHSEHPSWSKSEAALYARSQDKSGTMTHDQYVQALEALAHTRCWEVSKSLSDVLHPSQTIWAGDTNKVWDRAQGGYSEVFTDWMRRTDTPLRHKNEQETRQWYKDFLAHDYTYYQGICPNPSSYGCKSLAYRHYRSGSGTGSANVVYCDGHVKSMLFGTVTVDHLFP